VTELERLLDRTREALGAGDDDQLVDANVAINQALTLRPDSVDGWLLKCQVCSAAGDDVAALAAAEMALSREPARAECLYWHGAVLGDLGQHREALRAIESGFRAVVDDEDAARPDGEEIIDVRWFTRAEIGSALEGEGPVGLPGKASIARALIAGWYEERA
jgi:tetratricopeptide (TPR) repeat protein